MLLTDLPELDLNLDVTGLCTVTGSSVNCVIPEMINHMISYQFLAESNANTMTLR